MTLNGMDWESVGILNVVWVTISIDVNAWSHAFGLLLYSIV